MSVPKGFLPIILAGLLFAVGCGSSPTGSVAPDGSDLTPPIEVGETRDLEDSGPDTATGSSDEEPPARWVLTVHEPSLGDLGKPCDENCLLLFEGAGQRALAVRLSDAAGEPRHGERLRFHIEGDPEVFALSAPEAMTEADGVARVDLVVSQPCECRPAQSSITVTAIVEPPLSPVRFDVVWDAKCTPPLKVAVLCDPDIGAHTIVEISLYDSADTTCDTLLPIGHDDPALPTPLKTAEVAPGLAAVFTDLGLEWSRPRRLSVLAFVETEEGLSGWACDDESVILACQRSMTLSLPCPPLD